MRTYCNDCQGYHECTGCLTPDATANIDRLTAQVRSLRDELRKTQLDLMDSQQAHGVAVAENRRLQEALTAVEERERRVNGEFAAQSERLVAAEERASRAQAEAKHYHEWGYKQADRVAVLEGALRKLYARFQAACPGSFFGWVDAALTAPPATPDKPAETQEIEGFDVEAGASREQMKFRAAMSMKRLARTLKAETQAATCEHCGRESEAPFVFCPKCGECNSATGSPKEQAATCSYPLGRDQCPLHKPSAKSETIESLARKVVRSRHDDLDTGSLNWVAVLACHVDALACALGEESATGSPTSAGAQPDAVEQLGSLLKEAGANPYLRVDLARALKAEKERDDYRAAHRHRGDEIERLKAGLAAEKQRADEFEAQSKQRLASWNSEAEGLRDRIADLTRENERLRHDSNALVAAKTLIAQRSQEHATTQAALGRAVAALREARTKGHLTCSCFACMRLSGAVDSILLDPTCNAAGEKYAAIEKIRHDRDIKAAALDRALYLMKKAQPWMPQNVRGMFDAALGDADGVAAGEAWAEMVAAVEAAQAAYDALAGLHVANHPEEPMGTWVAELRDLGNALAKVDAHKGASK